MPKKIRKIEHKTHKFFGFSDEKWARHEGVGYGMSKKHGYGSHYGLNIQGGHNIDHRTKNEIKNRDDRFLEKKGEI